MARKKGYDQYTDLAALKYRLRRTAEEFRDERPDFIAEGEMLHVEAWIEKTEDRSNEAIYDQPVPLEIVRTRRFTLLNPALITYGELRTFKGALQETPNAYKYLETLLIEFKNQPTHFEKVLRKAFGLAAIGGLPSFLKNPEDTVRYFREFFRGIDCQDLTLVISELRVQLWEIKR